MGARVPVQQYNLRSANPYIEGGSSLHDLNTVDGRPPGGDIDGIDRDAVTDDSLDNDGESSAVGCIHESYRNSLPLHSVGVEEDRSSLENNGSSRDPYNILTINDITPIEVARARFLDIMVDHFISSHVTEVHDSEVDYMSQTAQDKLSKRRSKEIQYEGPCIFKRRELATSFETRSRFPELVIQEEKRVRFVVVNGLAIIEKPTNMRVDDVEWFKRLTGRNEVAVSARDYKFYAPRHKYRRVTPNSVSNIPGLPIFSGTDDSSPMANSQGYRSISEPQNQQQTSSKQHMQTPLHQGQFHPLHPSHQPINQNQHVGHFSHNHQCGPPSHLPEIAHGQQSSTISQHMTCLQPLGHVGGRLHVLPTSPAKFCDECGAPYLRETSKFCSECGVKRLGT